VKKDGRLVGVDYAAVRAMAERTRDHVVGQMPGAELGGGWHPKVDA
jgi:5-methylthioadenosine/S-adenosylhomocysteine deaminase